MQRIRFCLLFLILAQYTHYMSQNSTIHKGIYAIYETVNYETQLKQWIPSSKFRENYNAVIYSYPGVKVGFSYTAWGNLGLTDWAVWGIDLGIGVSYNKSIMNAMGDGINYGFTPTFGQTSPNRETFFSYYQPGNLCKLDDYGLNIHVDAGTILYAGVELDAGPSRIRFTDDSISGQKIKSTGWFVNSRIQGGVSLPLMLRLNSAFKINFKAYAVLYGWSGRYYKLDWIAEDKKLKNFSVLETKGNPFGLGFSITFLLED